MAKKPTDPDVSTAPETSVHCRCKVLKNGLIVAGGVAAAGVDVNLTEAAAKFHEERGEVEILGTL